MPERVTISDDLQITIDGSSFLSKSGKDLESAAIDVANWLARNEHDPSLKKVEQWQEAATTRLEILRKERGRKRWTWNTR